jgi:hypothetical protein
VHDGKAFRRKHIQSLEHIGDDRPARPRFGCYQQNQNRGSDDRFEVARLKGVSSDSVLSWTRQNEKKPTVTTGVSPTIPNHESALPRPRAGLRICGFDYAALSLKEFFGVTAC